MFLLTTSIFILLLLLLPPLFTVLLDTLLLALQILNELNMCLLLLPSLQELGIESLAVQNSERWYQSQDLDVVGWVRDARKSPRNLSANYLLLVIFFFCNRVSLQVKIDKMKQGTQRSNVTSKRGDRSAHYPILTTSIDSSIHLRPFSHKVVT